MQNSQLDRLLRLIRRTGDKAVVVDRDSEHIFMLMDLDDYEDMLDVVDDGGVDPIDEDDDDGNDGGSDDDKTIDGGDSPTSYVPIPEKASSEPVIAQEDLGNTEPPDVEDSLDDYVLDDMLDVESAAEDKKSAQSEQEEIAEVSAPEIEPEAAPVAEKNEPITIEPIALPGQASPLTFEENWPESQKNANSSEESLTDVPNDGEEEKFYLEPVE